jgi:hypothetical protein
MTWGGRYDMKKFINTRPANLLFGAHVRVELANVKSHVLGKTVSASRGLYKEVFLGTWLLFGEIEAVEEG